jgi:hypothetical protein
LKNKHLIFKVLGVVKSKIRVLANPVFGEGFLVDLQKAVFSLYPSMVKRGRRGKLPLVFLLSFLIPSQI